MLRTLAVEVIPLLLTICLPAGELRACGSGIMVNSAFLAETCDEIWLMYEVMYGSPTLSTMKFAAFVLHCIPPNFTIDWRIDWI